jgi:hypothetical protein
MQMLPEYDLLSDKYWFENYPISKETELYVSHGSPIKTWLFLYWLWENENIEFNKIYSLRVNGGKFCLESSLPLNDHPATINFLETLLWIQFFGPEEEKDLILMEEKLASVFDLMEYNKRVETRDLITNKAIRVFWEWSTTHTYLIRLLENIVNTDPDDDTQ